MIDEARNQCRGIGLHENLVVIGVVVPGDLARLGKLTVEGVLPAESDRIRAHSR